MNPLGQMILLKDKEWIANQKIAGQCVAAIHKELTNMTVHSVSYSGLEYQKKADEVFEQWKACPTFKNYKGFPGSICLSINKELVHGVPSERYVVEGDVVSFDLGATFKTSIADAAITVIKGKARDPRHIEVIEVCREALKNAIDSIRLGQPIGCIGYAIDRTVKKTPFGLVTHYGGHGINGECVHADPFIHNKSQKTEGIRATVGLTIAIEPMVTLCRDTETKVLDDGWTVVTKDIGAHFEHSVALTEDGIQIQTLG